MSKKSPTQCVECHFFSSVNAISTFSSVVGHTRESIRRKGLEVFKANNRSFSIACHRGEWNETEKKITTETLKKDLKCSFYLKFLGPGIFYSDAVQIQESRQSRKESKKMLLITYGALLLTMLSTIAAWIAVLSVV